MTRNLILIAVTLAIVIAIPVVLLRRREPPVDRVTAVAYQVMKSDLAGLARAEATTRMIRGRFLNDPERAGHISSPGVNPPVIILSDTGWAATVTHKFIPDIRCGIGVYIQNPVKRSAKSGEIVCE